MKFTFCILLSILVCHASSLIAQEAEEDTTPVVELEEIVTIGTRAPDRSRLDSPVPVDVISEDKIRQTGHTEVGRVLQTLAPSFNFSSSSISDGTDALRPATLRGLGPDQVLVLVNGKRRHGSALIHVNTSVGRGTAGVDMNAIPASAIKRIEVLRDGASAQYGSDALAGVINIVLKDDYEEGGFRSSYGSTYAGDGGTFVLGANKGFKFGEDGAFHGAFEYRDRQPTNRAGLTGVVQYPDTEVGEGAPVQIMKDSGNKEHNFDRQNFRIGDAESRQTALVLNLDKPIDSIWEGGTFYSFLDFSNRQNTSAGFYRRANQLDRNPEGSTYPDGFLPLINTDVLDYSIGVGLKRTFANGLLMDASVVTGGNTFAFNISNSHNASLVAAEGASPSSADAGDLRLFLNTVGLDFSLPMNWGNVAAGGGFRNDIYQIRAGEKVSYHDYDGPGGAAGGIQVFPGFQPSNEVDELRTAFAFYTDVELRPIKEVLINPAARIENYSDFGSTINGKVALRYEPMEMFALRAPPVSPRRRQAPTDRNRSRLPDTSARPAIGRVRQTMRAGMQPHSRFESHSVVPRGSVGRGSGPSTPGSQGAMHALDSVRLRHAVSGGAGSARGRRLRPAGFMRLPSIPVAPRRPRCRPRGPSPPPRRVSPYGSRSCQSKSGPQNGTKRSVVSPRLMSCIGSSGVGVSTGESPR